MEYPFRMYGETVEIYRYKADYTEQTDAEGEPEAVTYYTPYEDDAQYVAEKHGGTVTALDTSAYAWIDGLAFPSHDEARAAYDLGEQGYMEKKQAESTPQEDTDAMLVDHEYRLILLELGV